MYAVGPLVAPVASCPRDPLTTDKGIIILKSPEISPHGRVKTFVSYM